MPSFSVVFAVTAATALALVPLASAQSVYVPGNVEQAPGATVQELGVGPDGLTSYLVNGVTIAAGASTVVATEIGQAGAVVYNCAIGADAQATCSVSQVYDGATYGYTEPVSYFSGGGPPGPPVPSTTAPDPLATSTSVDPLATSTTSRAAALTSATSTPATIASSSNSQSTSSSAPTSSSSQSQQAVGPQANQPQPTSSNVFGASGAASMTSATTGSLLAGCAALAAAYFAI